MSSTKTNKIKDHTSLRAQLTASEAARGALATRTHNAELLLDAEVRAHSHTKRRLRDVLLQNEQPTSFDRAPCLDDNTDFE